MAEEEPYSLNIIAKFQKISTKEFEKQYKEHLSDFRQWKQKEHATEWLLFEDNMGSNLSIDETSVSNGELYTIITNKALHGKKGALVATIEGTKAIDIYTVLSRIPKEQRDKVEEVTMDFCSSMRSACQSLFTNANIVIDRFHVQKLITEAVQEIRIKRRHETIREINEAIKRCREQKIPYKEATYMNGDTKKQLLARSRYLLFKPKSKWTDKQKTRSVVLFKVFPEIKEAYHLSMMFRNFYHQSQTKKEAKTKLQNWYGKVEEKDIDSFTTTAKYIKNHQTTILNYFPNRSTNASAESFNAKIKGFRALVRGVRDKSFFLFRIAKIYG